MALDREVRITIRAIDRATAGFKSIGRAGDAALHVIKRGAIAAAVGVGAFATAIGFAMKQGIAYNKSLEGYQATLTAVLKSHKKAAETVEWAKRTAASTPFDLPQVVQATTRLEAMGVAAKGVITGLGNLASVHGKSLMQSVEAFLDARVGEWERLKEFGLKKEMLIPYGLKLDKQGALADLKSAETALMNYVREKFPTQMATAMKGFGGIMSNLGDEWKRLLGDIAKPLFGRLKTDLKSLLDYMTNMRESGKFDQIFSGWSQGIAGLVGKIGEFGKAMGKTLLGSIEVTGKKFNEFVKAIDVKKVADFANKIYELAKALAKAAVQVGDFVVKHGKLLVDLGKLYLISKGITMVHGLASAFVGLGKNLVLLAGAGGPVAAVVMALLSILWAYRKIKRAMTEPIVINWKVAQQEAEKRMEGLPRYEHYKAEQAEKGMKRFEEVYACGKIAESDTFLTRGIQAMKDSGKGSEDAAASAMQKVDEDAAKKLAEIERAKRDIDIEFYKSIGDEDTARGLEAINIVNDAMEKTGDQMYANRSLAIQMSEWRQQDADKQKSDIEKIESANKATVEAEASRQIRLMELDSQKARIMGDNAESRRIAEDMINARVSAGFMSEEEAAASLQNMKLDWHQQDVENHQKEMEAAQEKWESETKDAEAYYDKIKGLDAERVANALAVERAIIESKQDGMTKTMALYQMDTNAMIAQMTVRGATEMEIEELKANRKIALSQQLIDIELANIEQREQADAMAHEQKMRREQEAYREVQSYYNDATRMFETYAGYVQAGETAISALRHGNFQQAIAEIVKIASTIISRYLLEKAQQKMIQVGIKDTEILALKVERNLHAAKAGAAALMMDAVTFARETAAAGVMEGFILKSEVEKGLLRKSSQGYAVGAAATAVGGGVIASELEKWGMRADDGRQASASRASSSTSSSSSSSGGLSSSVTNASPQTVIINQYNDFGSLLDFGDQQQLSAFARKLAPFNEAIEGEYATG